MLRRSASEVILGAPRRVIILLRGDIMAETIRVIKKYQNRKLYDTQDSCYVTLDGIAKMIREGQEIVVIDNNTKADVTALILTQVLYEQEKTHQSVLPVTILKTIIKSGSNNLFEFMRKYILGILDTQTQSAEDLRTHLERLVAKGDLTQTEATNLQAQIETAAMACQNSLDKRIETQLDRYLANNNVATAPSTDFQAIANRVSTLESRA